MPRSLRQAILLLLLSYLLAATARADEPAKTPLEGTWVVVAAEVEGKADDKIVGDRAVFAGDQLTIHPHQSNKPAPPATVTLRSDKTPATIDLRPSDSNPPMSGIYELAGDGLKICIKLGGGRPTAFKTTPNSGLMLLVFDRQKEKP